ncbi:aspartate kinase [Acetobacteraceae bacterium]|nr:aspartate kinase [Acetobacteraceae bacterium]
MLARHSETTVETFSSEKNSKMVVMKFGGTSVGNLDRMRASADLIKREVMAGNKVAVVVSAMAGMTNELIGRCLGLSKTPDAQEYDTVLSSGEQISSGLLAVALQNQGVKARSFQGWQIPIRVLHRVNGTVSFMVESEKLMQSVEMGEVPVISGFQGIDTYGRIATLGRGGSDATAVSVAASLKADQCDIYTDVEGVYSGDPRVIEKAQLLSEITFEEMLEFSKNGAKVLQPLSVSMAMAHNVPVRVLSAFVPLFEGAGTKVISGSLDLERVIGVSRDLDKAAVILLDCDPSEEVQKVVLDELRKKGIMIEASAVGVSTNNNSSAWSLFMSKGDALVTAKFICCFSEVLAYSSVEIETGLSKVTVIGRGLLKKQIFLDLFLKSLSESRIDFFTLLREDLKIFAFTPQAVTSELLSCLHHNYGLDKKA